MSAIRISREPTQAFVQYMAWEGSGYASFLNPFLSPPQKKQQKNKNQNHSCIQDKEQKNWKFMLLSQKVF